VITDVKNYRINVVTIQLPSLKERPEDIPLLAYHIIRQLNQKSFRSSIFRKFTHFHCNQNGQTSFFGYYYPEKTFVFGQLNLRVTITP